MRDLSYYVVAAAALVFVAFGMAKISEVRESAPRADRFGGCFESVVPRRQFICRDGSYWTRTVAGWRVDYPEPGHGPPGMPAR